MALKKLENAEQVFNYLKTNDLNFKKIKEDSEYSNSWPRFKEAMLLDELGIKYLERRINELNNRISENISKGQKASKKSKKAQKKLAIIGAENLKKKTSDSEHQRKAAAAGHVKRRENSAKRLNDLIEFILERLPKEFTDSDIYSIIDNNSDNTVFQKSQNNLSVLKPSTIFRKFTSTAKKRGLIVRIKCANQHQLSTYHIVNKSHVQEKSTHEYHELLEFAYGI